MTRSLARLLAPAALVVGLAACAPVQPEVKAPPAAEQSALEVDPSRLCQVAAEVEDATYFGRGDALRVRLEANATEDRAAAFGALLLIDDEDRRWKAFREDASRRPDSAIGPLGECFVYADWGLPDQARAPCDAAAARLSGAAIVDVARGRLLARRGLLEEATASFRGALSRDEGCAAAHLGLGRVLGAAGDADGAVSAYQAALAAFPACFSCAAASGALVEKARGAQAALPYWEAALAIVPDHPETLQRYAAALVGQDDAKALAAYEQALLGGAKDRSTLLAAARLAQRTGAFGKALDYGERAVQAEPDDLELWRLLASLYQESADGAGSERAWAEILRLDPQDAAAHLALARARRTQERLVDALVHYEAAANGTSGAEGDASLNQAAGDELAALLRELGVAAEGPSGAIGRVIGQVERRARRVFEARVREQGPMRGQLDVVIITGADGGASEVRIERDTLGDARVAATVFALLGRARIEGGAKRYALQLEFQ